ncbi:MAG: mannitol dehydrogenase family protein [Bacteroidales bacterium]|nr:mannitol dehydrogenase family protein [Bacteroidales bacterium]
MSETIKLNANNLEHLPEGVMVPNYNRTKIKTGIVHVGVGNFHRAHQAFYTDQLLCKGKGNWGISGIGLLNEDRKMYHAFTRQDGLYTLMVLDPDEKLRPRVIGSIVEYLFAPENPDRVIEKMADPEVRIISLTITEGGYNQDPATGEFNMSEKSVQWDLHHPDQPQTIFGYLTQALKHRRERKMPGLTILSCDNIQHNGEVCKKMLISYMKEAEPNLVNWVEQHISFPNSMVDRITPVTTPSDKEHLKVQFGIEDLWPVVCEPFIQWVIEDNFANGRPEWESVGVQFVEEVDPYEKMKIRLLNAGHSLLGLTGLLYGYRTIDETVRNPLLASLLREFMDKEATLVLGKIEGIELEGYKDNLVQRFSNTKIKDQVSRICAESSAKIPKFLLPTIREQLDRGGSIQFGTLIVATWCRNLELAGTSDYSIEIQDSMRNELEQKAKASVNDDPLSFLRIEAIFGNLVHYRRFVDTYLQMINELRRHHIDEVISKLLRR